jgi:hypothetical protein
MANGSKIKSMGKASMCGPMAGGTRGSGKTTICMGRVFTHGKTAVGMRESTLMTENTALGSTLGRTDVSMRATGTTESSMVKGFTVKQMARTGEAGGKKASALHGLMNFD